jgi:hypothetical protein
MLAVPSSLHGTDAPSFNVDLKQREKSQGDTLTFDKKKLTHS